MLNAAKRHRHFLLAVGAVGALVVAAVQPTTTYVGIDYVVHAEHQPLYAKAIAFIARDIEMRALALRVSAGGGTDEQITLRMLDWTHANIRPQPRDLPVVDDHPYNVVVRGYGTYDQAASVFALLVAYCGVPATWMFSRPAGLSQYAFAFALLDEQWRVFDPREGVAFKDRDGALGSLAVLQRDAELTQAMGTPNESRTPYSVLLRATPEVTPPLKPYDHMLLGRPFH